METQSQAPLPIQEVNVATPSGGQVATESINTSNQTVSSKKYTVVLSVILGVSVIALSSYFIVTKTSLLFSKKSEVAIIKIPVVVAEPVVTQVGATSTIATSSSTEYYLRDERVSDVYHFKYPLILNLTRMTASRDTGMETTLKKSPLYHSEPFGLEQTFADMNTHFSGFFFGYDYASSTSPQAILIKPDTPPQAIVLDATFSVHKIASSTVYLTSSMYGYNPSDWGKITGAISIHDFANEISTKTNTLNHKMTIETINGIRVRHILPFGLPRPYENETREQYQWVKDGSLFSLVFNAPMHATISTALSQDLKQQLINSIFSTLEVTQ